MQLAVVGLIQPLALVIQPLIGPLFGRSWSQAEIFGIAPDPTAIGTLGLLLVIRARMTGIWLVIPVIWCCITGATLWTMQAPDALIAPVAALILLLGVLAKARRSSRKVAV